MAQLSVLNKLRITHLLFGMMFFYGIEQVFLNHYIITSSARGLVSVVFTIGLLLFDIPTGILADRIGRKKSLLLGCAALILALLVLGTSRSLLAYLAGSLVFSLFIALWNGASQALLYDHLAAENRTALYAKNQGSVYALFLIGAGIANAVSGFIANAFGLPSAYYLSIIPAVLAAIMILGIPEPPIEKQVQPIWYKHIGDITREMSHHHSILLYAIRFIVAEITVLSVGEFGQIYMLSFGVSVILLGIYWSISAVFAAGGRYAAHHFQQRPRLFLGLYSIVLAAFALTTQSYGIGLFWLLYGLNEALQNIAETEIQHVTTARVRATTLSIISFAGYALSVPILLAYTWYYTRHGIIAANRWVAASMILLLAFSVVFERRGKAI